MHQKDCDGPFRAINTLLFLIIQIQILRINLFFDKNILFFNVIFLLHEFILIRFQNKYHQTLIKSSNKTEDLIK